MASFRFTVKADAVHALADNLARLKGVSVREAVSSAINITVDQTYELTRERITAGINLTDDYVRRKMRVDHASEKSLQATITAFGGKAGTTALSHYDVSVQTKDVTWSNARIEALGLQFGPWPGWTKRTGSAALGIPIGKKSAGRGVSVSRGSNKTLRNAFAMPGKRDTEGNYLVFRRDENGKIRSLLGPSVYQLFRYQLNTLDEQIADSLADNVATFAQNEFERILK